MSAKLENRVFGRLKVVRKVETRFTKGGNPIGRWLCLCSCGKEKVVSTNSLQQGKTKSCGCLLAESAQSKGHNNKTHGDYSKFASMDEKIRRQAWSNIQERSKRRGYSSDLEISDLPVLGVKCPILGVAYTKGSLKNKDYSPSVDRINSNLPYLKKYKDNLVFISHRANRIKSDASVEELRLIIQYIEASKYGCESSLIDSKPGQKIG